MNERNESILYDQPALGALLANIDTRSIPELIAAATDWTQSEGWGDWGAVVSLQRIGSREVLDQALILMTLTDPRTRARGADILGQLGSPARTFPEECLKAVTDIIAHDTDARVLQAAAVALGHLRDSRGTKALVNISNNADPEVKQAVAFALGGRIEQEAITTLIQLTADEKAIVRDWATFGLGEIGTLDMPEIREALTRRLSDPDSSTRYEAIRGLAKWRDRRVLPILIELLQADPEDCELYLPALSFLGIGDEVETPTAEELITRLQKIE